MAVAILILASGCGSHSVSGPSAKATTVATQTLPAAGPTTASPPFSGGTVLDSLLPPDVPWTYQLADVVISLERTHCFGGCPAYTVTIHGDGRVVYQGRDAQATSVPEESHIDREAVEDVLDAFYDVDFFGMAERYTERLDIEVLPDGTVNHVHKMISDLPTQTVTLKIGPYEKRVVDYWGAPESLRELEERIDDTAGVSR